MRDPQPSIEYYRTHEFTAELRGQTIRVISKPGLPDWDRVAPATILLANAVQLRADSRVLLLGCNHGALAVVLAREASRGTVCLSDTNSIALAMSDLTLTANAVSNSETRSAAGAFHFREAAHDTVVMHLPKGRRLARRWLLASFRALIPGGRLYLAGANEEGIKSAIKDVEALFGDATVVAYKKGNRVAYARKVDRSRDPPWATEPGVAPGTWYELQADIPGMSFHLRTLPGIFAYDRLDEGTEILLSRLQVPQDAHVLDVGCGYGIIGPLTERLGAGHVDMIDVDTSAVAAAVENIARNGLTRAQSFASDALQAVSERRYNLIVTNPPFHVGKAADYDVTHAIIRHSREVLESRCRRGRPLKAPHLDQISLCSPDMAI